MQSSAQAVRQEEAENSQKPVLPVKQGQPEEQGRPEEQEQLEEQGRFEEAVSAFKALGDYSDAEDRIQDVRYARAEELLAQGK